MKKLTAILLTAVLLVSAIQPVCAAQTDTPIKAAIPQAVDNLPSASKQDSQNLPSSEPPKEEIGRIVSPDQAKKASTTESEEDIQVEFSSGQEYDSTLLFCSLDKPIDSYNSWVYLTCRNFSDSPITLSISSSNTDVLKITSDTKKTLKAGYYIGESIKFTVIGVGSADIIVSIGKTSYKYRLYILPYITELPKITQTDFHHITLKWKKLSGISGFYVQRSKKYDGEYKTLKTLDANKTSITLPVESNKKYYYKVVGYIMDDFRTMTGDAYQQGFTAKKMAGSTITSVKKSGSSSLQIKWKAFKGATGYKLYCSNQENGTYKCIYTAKNGATTSYKQKVSKGVPYYYKLITLDAMGKSDFSPMMSQIIPKKIK